MRWEVAAAYVLGVLLPILEVLRRRTNVESVASYVDDFLAGALLLFAARSVTKGRPSGPVLLAVACAVLCGGLYSSFFGQIERGRGTDVSGLSNAAVVAVKGALYTVAVFSLVRSVRAATPRDEG